jgi:hypothetical protein
MSRWIERGTSSPPIHNDRMGNEKGLDCIALQPKTYDQTVYISEMHRNEMSAVEGGASVINNCSY